MFIWVACLILAGCLNKTKQEVPSIPILRISSINVINQLKPDNNTEGYATELWIRKVQQGFIKTNAGDDLVLEVLKSTVITFQSHISFHITVVYYLNKKPIKTQVEIKGTKDLTENCSLVLERVAQAISAEILKNLSKDYGEPIAASTATTEKTLRMDSRRSDNSLNLDEITKFIQKANDLDRKAGQTLEQAMVSSEPRASTAAVTTLEQLQKKAVKPKVEPKVIVPIDLLGTEKTGSAVTVTTAQPSQTSVKESKDQAIQNQNSRSDTSSGEQPKQEVITKEGATSSAKQSVPDLQMDLQSETPLVSTQKTSVNDNKAQDNKSSLSKSEVTLNTDDPTSNKTEITDTSYKPNKPDIASNIDSPSTSELDVPVTPDGSSSKAEESESRPKGDSSTDNLDMSLNSDPVSQVATEAKNLSIPDEQNQNTRYEKLVN